MKVNRLVAAVLMFSLASVVAVTTNMLSTTVSAQSIISGDITGTIADPSGAALLNAQVEVTSATTGQTKTVIVDKTGGYRVPLLPPGKYKVTASVAGFDTVSATTTVATGSIATVNLVLAVGKALTTVEVSGGDIQTLDVDDAQLSTSFDVAQIQNLPNPGNDLTFVAQTTPGAVMNTQSGYGNFSVNGLPGTSNMYTVNGGYEGDPYLNVGNSGASNLLLGNNDVDTVTVTTNSFDVAFGGLGGAQVNEMTRSGSNQYHGNALYWWNGRAMNANSWFNKYYGTARAFDNANQWATSVGGPIKKNKIFGFVDYEGIRVLIPTRGTVYAPSPNYQAAILGTASYDTISAANPNGLIPDGNLAYNGLSSQASLYKTIFSYYNNAKNFSQGSVDANDPDTWIFNGQATNFAKEWLINDRVDVVLGPQDNLFVHSKVDHGVQPTESSYLDSVFAAQSPQPAYEGQFGYNHTFSSTLTNQFLFAASYARSIFTNTNASKAFASVPFVLIAEGENSGCVQYKADGTTCERYYDWNSSGAGQVGGEDYAFPQGRMVTGYQFNDDLTWIKGKHTLKFGYTFRRDDITDYTSSEHAYGKGGAESLIYDQGDFAAGYSDVWVERFANRPNQPVALYVEGAYAQDQWKPLPNLTVTAGIRAEHNSNPICVTNCVSNFAQDFSSLPSSTSSPYNTIMASGRHRAFFKEQSVAYQPRIGFAYLPSGANSKTTIRGGVGFFNDYFPAQVMGNLVSNMPSVDRFTAYGAYYGYSTVLDPTSSASGHYEASVSNAALQSLYSKGACYSGCGSSLSLSTVTGGVFTRPTVVGTAHNIKLPTYIEWNFAVEHEVYRNTALKLTYVGNRSYHQPVSYMPNAYYHAYSSTGANATLPTSRPNAALGSVTEYYSGSSSNYNGLQAQLVSRVNWLTYSINYAWGHALDTTSNGGFDSFGDNSASQINPYNLRQNYGNADYDVRQYVSGNYVIAIPHTKGPRLFVDNWEVSGTVFHNTGYPFSVTDTTGNIVYGNAALAKQKDNHFNHHCGGNHAAKACDFASHFTNSTDYGQQARNQLFGPNYTDVDMDVAKGFELPYTHGAKLKVAVQFFNLFNHPNFSQPDFEVNDGTFGTITSTASTPTSILGSGLGGDASPRLIQLKGSITF
ncbi:carboxypeptidase regulatory-like domain-containing protein [Telmatobacter bradus]|uniref:carboxypeptidase regulatory-like domain-containing protein n=1 Tax=Telmatobacter bradus TaxID=474953 RepID=UPI003B427A83